ncbi:hypothetical protein F5Y16DRAFT_363054 [Xylariaceae sp. FL0255]|nr:hypothetical protein F5Y16DRAFT_363054 [Xylariaceae sp. FL0255]
MVDKISDKDHFCDCPPLSVSHWNRQTGKVERPQIAPYKISIESLQNECHLVPADSPVCVIQARANAIRKCERCRTSLVKAFGMPEYWWTDWCQNSNGYHSSETTRDEAGMTGFNTWVYFETKEASESEKEYDKTISKPVAQVKYHWFKINVFMHYIPSTKQTFIVMFDMDKAVIDRLIDLIVLLPNTSNSPSETSDRDPFWVYAKIAGELVRLQDTAVWHIRNLVRNREKELKETGRRPQPNYRALHDIARHAIHVSETLDVATETVAGLITQHEEFRKQQEEGGDHNNYSRIHGELLFHNSMLNSLKHRAASNKARLENEIHLAFNDTAQYDSRIAVKIGRAAQGDSAAMKTIAFFTMAFLPATFLSAIFSMSFFNFDPDADVWRVSNKIWIYFAFAAPVTLATFLGWYFWQLIFPTVLIGEKED